MAITHIDITGAYSWPPQMIQPFGLWIRCVIQLHFICKDKSNQNGPYWYRCYQNNESPLYACRKNYDFAPSPFTSLDLIRLDPRYTPEMEMPPLAGIGELSPKVPFEL